MTTSSNGERPGTSGQKNSPFHGNSKDLIELCSSTIPRLEPAIAKLLIVKGQIHNLISHSHQLKDIVIFFKEN